jgi:hypothetical protein
MHRRRPRTAVLAAGTAMSLALLTGACSSDTPMATNGTTAPSTMAPMSGSTMAMQSSTDSPAAGLRATLTDQLTNHVYLAGIAISTAVAAGPDSPAAKAAIATLDQNSVELSKSIGSVYGDAAGDQFLALWRKHIGFFVDYTLGKATGDTAKADKARSDLDSYRNDFGAFLAAANPNLTKAAVADELKPHVDTLITAIDKVVAKDPGAYDALKTAAGHMPHTADTLAGAIAKQGT